MNARQVHINARSSAARRRSLRAAALAMALAVLASLGVVGSASAALTRSPVAAFGADGTSGGSSFETPQAVAFDQSSKRLYVLDQSGAGGGGSGAKLHAFDASTPGDHVPVGGAFPLDFAPNGTTCEGRPCSSGPGYADDLAVDSVSHNFFFVEETTSLFGFDSSGAQLGGNLPVTGFGDACGGAVDPAGDVWVSDYADQRVKHFDSAGSPLGSVDTSAQGFGCRVAFDSAGDLYVASFFGPTWRYTAASGYTDGVEIDSGTAVALAVDRSTDNVYVVHGNGISIYDQAGVHLYDFGATVAGASYQGIAINEATDEVYVSDAGNGLLRVFGQPIPLPEASTLDADGVSDVAATLRASVNPAGDQLTDCHFDFVPASQFDTDGYASVTPAQQLGCTPDAASLPADSTAHTVSASAAGLDPGTTYHFRVVVTSSQGTVEGSDLTFRTALGAPLVNGTSVGSVGLSDVTLRAQLNPQGARTTYHFDYGTTTAYGQSTAESSSIGFDTSDHAVAKSAGGLSPVTTYHFRVVATNAAGTTNGPDSTFTTYAPATGGANCANDDLRGGVGAGLPDCRAYEQSTPIAKNGNNAAGDVNFVGAADDGDAVTFLVLGGVPGGSGAQDFPIYLARRGSADWQSSGLYPPASAGQSASIEGWTRDLDTVFSSATLTASNEVTFLARDSASQASTTIVPYLANSASATPYAYVGASTDGSKVYFEDIDDLTPGAAAGVVNLYVWDRASGAVRLAGVLPDSDCGSPPCAAPDGSFAGPYLVNVDSGGAAKQAYTRDNRAVSADGDRVFFTARGSGQLYLRESAASPSATTLHVSASQKTNGAGPGGRDPNGPRPAQFAAASADGSRVLFISCEQLTNDSTAVSVAGDDRCRTTDPGSGPPYAYDRGQDLYSYDVVSGELTDLTVDSSATDPQRAGVQTILGSSTDGAYVYFQANGVLAPGATLGTCRPSATAVVGTCNLYVAHEGDITFISPIAGTSGTSSAGGGPPARVSADGRAIVFLSDDQLTAYENLGPTCIGFSDANGGPQPGRCSELYRFEVGDAGPVCVSCNPTGAAPTGVGGAALRSIKPDGLGNGEPGATLTRNISADGSRVFFESPDRLLAADTNGVKDVYEWEADGFGSCASSAQNGGCLSLLSSGRSPDPSYFADASLSGDDAFFFTTESLVPQDRDAIRDIYDARVGGGLTGQHPVPLSPPCAGDVCHGDPAVRPVVPLAATVTFAGPGDVLGVRQRLGKVSVTKPRTVTGFTAQMRVKAPAAGLIEVAGSSIRKATRKATKAGTYTLTVELTAKARRSLKQRATIKVRVAFRPASGSPSTATVSLTFKRPAQRSTARHASTTRRPIR